MKKLIGFIFLVILVKTISANLVINEIMYDPTYDENYNEWIEIYNGNENEINLTDWELCDNEILPGYVNHSDENTYLDTTMILEPNQYAIITDGGSGTEVYDNFFVNNNSIALHVDGSSMCNRGLGNSDDIIIIKDSEEEIIEVVHYYSSWGASGNGFSLCKIPNENGVWQECSPTAGSENGQDIGYTLAINEFLPDPKGYDDAPIPGGEWVELYNYGDIAIDIEGLILNDDYGKGLEISEVNVLNSTIIQPRNFIVVYRNGNGRLELNNDGFDKVKLLNGGILIDEVSYDGSKEGLSWSKTEDGWIQTIPTPGKKNNVNEADYGSHLEIENVYLGSDKEASFGDLLRVKIKIYKGDTDKYSVQLWAEGDEEISKKTRFDADDRFTNYTLTLPLQLLPNCKNKYKDGEYDIVLKGLDKTVKEEIDIEGIDSSLCEKVEVSSSTKDVNYEITESQAIGRIDENIKTKVEIKNDGIGSVKVEVWSYIYSGPKCVSCISGDREENKKIISVSGESSKSIELENSIIDNTKPGNYKLKIKFKKEGRKTTDDFTQNIELIGGKGEKASLASSNLGEVEEISFINPMTVYESSGIESKRLSIYFFCFVLLVLIFELARKKDI